MVYAPANNFSAGCKIFSAGTPGKQFRSLTDPVGQAKKYIRITCVYKVILSKIKIFTCTK
jgi:hypothetical protein